ncbi:MAG: Crp/Fnr family transcriptional regulator [Bdellovibrionales bacterium]
MDQATVLNGGINNLGLSQATSAFSEVPYELIHFKEGDIIFKEGEESRGLYYMQTGCVKITMKRKQSRGRTTTADYVTKLVGPGEYFGYKSLIRGGKSKGTAKAVKSTTVWLYSKDKIMMALRSASPLVRFVLQQAVNDIGNFESVSQLHYLASVEERIAYQLILMAERFGVDSEKGIVLNLKLTRNELAQLASTINESLSRHLTEFKNEGLIDLNGKEIIITNKPGLMAKSGNF